MVITINNSFSNISGYTVEQEKELRKLLSYTPPAIKSFYGGGYQAPRYLIDKKGNFPTGLLSKVLLNYPGVTINDTRKLPKSVNMVSLSLPFNPYLEQEEIVDVCVRHHRGTISACTGFGKSLVMALLINKLKVRTLIVVPNLELKRQLTETFKTYFGETDKIVIENIDSNTLKNHKNFDMLLIDEAHHVAAKTYRDLNKKAWGGIYYRFFFTATPFRSQEAEQILFESIAGDVLYRMDYKTASSKGYIVPVEAYYVVVPRTIPKGNIKQWASMYSELVVNNEKRNNIITELVKNLVESGSSTLLLVKEIKHGKSLSASANLQFANGESEDTPDIIRFFLSGHLKAIIGTTGVIGEGVDTKPCEYVIIAGLGKSKPAFMQQVGRGVRRHGNKDSCKIILFKDPSHKWTLSHFKEQCKVLKEEYGVQPVEIRIELTQ